MPQKPSKDERRVLLRAVKQKQRSEAEARMPISRADLSDLFDYLDAKLEQEDCDHTARITREFLRQRLLPEEPITRWLEEYGGFCDCEVLANVENEWGE